MFVCMWIYVFVCIHVFVCVFVCVCVYICVYVGIRVCVYTCICVHVCMKGWIEFDNVSQMKLALGLLAGADERLRGARTILTPILIPILTTTLENTPNT